MIIRVNHPELLNKLVFRWRQKAACVCECSWCWLEVSSKQQVLQQRMSRRQSVFSSVVQWNHRVLMIGDGGRCAGCTSRSSIRAPFRGKRRTSERIVYTLCVWKSEANVGGAAKAQRNNELVLSKPNRCHVTGVRIKYNLAASSSRFYVPHTRPWSRKPFGQSSMNTAS